MKTMIRIVALSLCALLCASAAALAETKTVGIIQFAPHPSLDNCTNGFLAGLEEGGYAKDDTLKVDFQNAMGDFPNSDLLAKTMVSNGCDMLVGVATPSAMSAYAATKEEGIPVVFVAVSDAVSAGIVKSNEAPGTNCTGVSDVLNLEAQVQMIRAFLPDATTIGVIYTTSEPNSITHLGQLKDIAPGYGFAVEEVGVAAETEVAAAAATLVSNGVDCINNFTDNTVVNNLSQVLRATNEAGIPVFGSEVEQVVNGCLAAQGIDYFALGRVAGLMAAEIFDGATPDAMPVGIISECTPSYNSEVSARLGIALPEAYGAAEDVAQAE